jgi:two-component system alkaline phosphatase synthesis response regulator PhoP/two-component system response regulator VicR
MAYKVLIADDDVDSVGAIGTHLISANFDVVTAYNGLEALEKIKTENPDVVLLDILMPKMDGFDVLKEMRTHPPSQKWQPVIIISTQDEFNNIRKGYDLEADFYVTKPFTLEKISQAIQILISLIPIKKPRQE